MSTLTLNGIGRIAFQAWPKTPRLFRDCIITEKIDGTNSAVGIVPVDELGLECQPLTDPNVLAVVFDDERTYAVYAQSRKRLITPGKQTDNYGFAAWVQANAATLIDDLGPGLHFGEWWGYKIARSYGLSEGDRRFSLFNVSRYRDTEFSTPAVDVVPVLFEGEFRTATVEDRLMGLSMHGSKAVPGFMNPEGVVVYHTASNQVFKVLIENDELPKSVVVPVVEGKVAA